MRHSKLIASWRSSQNVLLRSRVSPRGLEARALTQEQPAKIPHRRNRMALVIILTAYVAAMAAIAWVGW